MAGFPFIVSFLTMSVLNEKGIDELRIMLADLIRSKSIEMRLPVNFHRIGELLQEKVTDYLQLSAFVELCKSMDIRMEYVR